MYVPVTPKISLMPWMKIVKEARFLLFCMDIMFCPLASLSSFGKRFLITLFKIFINTCE